MVLNSKDGHFRGSGPPKILAVTAIIEFMYRPVHVRFDFHAGH